MLAGDALGDRVDLVPSFVKSLRLQLEAITEVARDGRWPRLHKARPAAVDAAAWEALFLHVVAMLCLWLPSPADLLPFLHMHCDESSFAKLVLRRA